MALFVLLDLLTSGFSFSWLAVHVTAWDSTGKKKGEELLLTFQCVTIYYTVNLFFHCRHMYLVAFSLRSLYSKCRFGDFKVVFWRWHVIGCWSRWLWNVRPHNSTAVSLVLKVKIRDSRSSYLSPVQPSPVTDVLLGPMDLVHLDQTFCEAEMTHSLAHILRPTADSSVLLYSVMMPINSAASASFSTGSMQ